MSMVFTWNSWVTLWLVLADVSIKETPHACACPWPSAADTSRISGLSSHLLPASITGMVGSSAPFISFIVCHIGFSSSRDCLLLTEYTKMNAWPWNDSHNKLYTTNKYNLAFTWQFRTNLHDSSSQKEKLFPSDVI